MLLPHKRDTDVPDNPVSEVRDGPDALDTQREDWLLQTEPLHGARPRRNERERPPVIEDRAGVLDLEAAGGVRGRKVDQHGIQAPLLSLERQILLEEEVTTPPRGGGGVRPPRLRCRQEGRVPCLRFLQRSVHEMVVGTDRRMLDHR